MSSKKELRNLVRNRKAAHSPELLHALSVEACRRVCRLTIWAEAQTVLLYHPLADEVDVRMLIEKAACEGKKVYLPVVTGSESIELRRWMPETMMTTGAFGISEPIGTEISQEEYWNIDLAIIPGMAFDKEGHRLGRGKGYYDRLLTRLPQAQLCGICFRFPLLPTLPHEAHDINMNTVITGEEDI